MCPYAGIRVQRKEKKEKKERRRNPTIKSEDKNKHIVCQYEDREKRRGKERKKERRGEE